MQDSLSEGRYCSHSCLLGLATDTPSHVDTNCPNAAKHGKRHLRRSDFISMIRALLNSGSSSSCLVPLNTSGSRGSLYRVTLPSHGYVLLAKGVQKDDEPHLLNEADIYRRLAPLQGRHIPVFIGETSLSQPLIISGGQAQQARLITRLLFVSYAGIPMDACLNETNEDEFAQGIEECMKAIHALGVLHLDAASSNILWDEGSVRVIDFERSTTREKVEEEEQERKNKGEKSDKQSPPGKSGKGLWENECEKELCDAVYTASSWLSSVDYTTYM
ncbi:hypothetical protein MMC31_007015 [Peltigera leucophlebia]|nr:hypothetical protein [Peltigera leucophlebia]